MAVAAAKREELGGGCARQKEVCQGWAMEAGGESPFTFLLPSLPSSIRIYERTNEESCSAMPLHHVACSPLCYASFHGYSHHLPLEFNCHNSSPSSRSVTQNIEGEKWRALFCRRSGRMPARVRRRGVFASACARQRHVRAGSMPRVTSSIAVSVFVYAHRLWRCGCGEVVARPPVAHRPLPSRHARLLYECLYVGSRRVVNVL